MDEPRLDALRIPSDQLRWTCDPAWVSSFGTTAELEPIPGVIGQDDAIESLRFGLEINAPGQNVFVRGIVGTGRLTLLKRMLQEVRLACPLAPDRCYVHDFEDEGRPRELVLPRSRARAFAARVEELIEFIGGDLMNALSSEGLRDRRNALTDRMERERKELTAPFEKELEGMALALVSITMGSSQQMAIVPVIDDQPVAPEAYERKVTEGEISREDADATLQKIQEQVRRFESIAEKLEKMQEGHREEIRSLFETEARRALSSKVNRIADEFSQEEARKFLDQIVEDVVGQRLGALSHGEGADFTELYTVNVVSDHDGDGDCPVIVESHPTLQNLFGGIEREHVEGSVFRSDHRSVRVGSVVRADGGYLLLEARDVLTEPGAWSALKRFLRTGDAEIARPEVELPIYGPSVKPESPRVNVKVVLIGDPELYYLLDAADPEFPHLFKVLADFESTLTRDDEAVTAYARVVARIAKEEELLPFSGEGVAALAEHGARIAGRNDRLTTRFGRLADIAREASFITAKSTEKSVGRAQVEESVRNTKRRGDLPARRFRRFVREGTIHVATSGSVVGQVNGLAVVSAGPLTYGFPARITATIGPGTAGAINIEREAQLSGAIHTKGFYILGGLLRHLLRTEHPLAFSASIAFEQSYGGIDGDSASGAEMCCLLSALTGVPIRQDRAMTGAIDQHGRIQPIGAVNEKIEGYYDVCSDVGLTGDQGVIIPRANARDLMLRPDVVDACAAGRFSIFAVDTIHQALEVFTGVPVGAPDGDGEYPEGTLLATAVERAGAYWRMARGSLSAPGRRRDDDDDPDPVEEEKPTLPGPGDTPTSA